MRSLHVLLAALALVGCTSEVIGPDPTSSGHSMGNTTATTVSVGAGGSSSSSTTSTTTGAGGGSCCAGVQRTVSADTDPAQQVTGVSVPEAGNPYPMFVTNGPFFLTDFSGSDQATVVDTALPCDTGGSSAALVLSGSDLGFHGIRLYVPAGKKLCNPTANAVAFSGFRPY